MTMNRSESGLSSKSQKCLYTSLSSIMLDPYFNQTHFKVTFGPGLSESQQKSISGCSAVALMALHGSNEECKRHRLPTHVPTPPLQQPYLLVGRVQNTHLP